MSNTPDDLPTQSSHARTRSFGAWAGELAKGRARVERISREHPAADSDDDARAALEELRLTYEELSVAEEELRTQNEELRRAHLLIEQDRARYLELFRQAPVAYIVTDATGTIRDANLAASKLTQCRADRLNGKPLLVFTRDASRKRMRLALHRLGERAESLSFRCDVTARDESVIRVRATVAPVRDLKGRLIELRWQLVDERPQQRRERARKRRAAQLESLISQRTADLTRTQRLKDQLVATVSHELRTPLAAIGGYTDILTTGLRGPLNDAQQSDVQRIHRAYDHMARVVDDLLSYTRITSGRLAFDVRDVSLSSELRSVMELVAPQAGERGITLTVADPPDGTSLRADPERLRQILLNVIGNAVKYTPTGGLVDVRTSVLGAAALVEVEDTGRGIPQSQHEAIFEPFVRLTADQKEPGVGLGLAISREMARAMNGELSVRSTLGVGSCFTLRLPCSMSLAGDESD